MASNASGKPHCDFSFLPLPVSHAKNACWGYPKPLLKRRIDPAAARPEDAVLEFVTANTSTKTVAVKYVMGGLWLSQSNGEEESP